MHFRKLQTTIHRIISAHVGYLRTKKTSLTTGKQGLLLGNMNVTIVDKVESQDQFYIKERETYKIRKFNTFYRR